MDYLKSSSIKNNKISLEQMTLSIFPTVIIFLTPILIIQYFRKSCVNSKFFNWIIWIPILVLLNILPVLLYCSYVSHFYLFCKILFKKLHLYTYKKRKKERTFAYTFVLNTFELKKFFWLFKQYYTSFKYYVLNNRVRK